MGVSVTLPRPQRRRLPHNTAYLLPFGGNRPVQGPTAYDSHAGSPSRRGATSPMPGAWARGTSEPTLRGGAPLAKRAVYSENLAQPFTRHSR